MLKFALKNMAIKKVQIVLIVLSIVISAGIGVLAFNVATQVDDRTVFFQQLGCARVRFGDKTTDFRINRCRRFLRISASALVAVFHTHKHGLVAVVRHESELFAHTPLRYHSSRKVGNVL